MTRACWVLLLTLAWSAGASAAPPGVTIGAKKFTESIILAELAGHLIRATGARVRIRELGGTRTLWQALQSGDIDLYPEYTGTLLEEILSGLASGQRKMATARGMLEGQGIYISAPLGFNNTYAPS